MYISDLIKHIYSESVSIKEAIQPCPSIQLSVCLSVSPLQLNQVSQFFSFNGQKVSWTDIYHIAVIQLMYVCNMQKRERTEGYIGSAIDTD